MAAAETAERANQDAELHRERARVADQKATALLHTAAEKAEAVKTKAEAKRKANAFKARVGLLEGQLRECKGRAYWDPTENQYTYTYIYIYIYMYIFL